MIKWFLQMLARLEGKDKAYVSEAGKFLHAFDKAHPKRSASQRAEVEKHRGIFKRKSKVI